MSANITISLPLETIAAVQSSTGPGLTPEILKHVSPALIRAAKALPVTFTPRKSIQDDSAPANNAAITNHPKPEPDSDLPAAKRRLVSPSHAFTNLLGDFAQQPTAPRAPPLPAEFKIQVVLRGQPDRKLMLLVAPYRTMEGIKKMIAKVWTDVAMEHQSLSTGRGRIWGSEAVRNAGIKPNTTIYLDPCVIDLKSKQATPQPNVLVKAQTLDGKTLSFNIPLSTTVEKMKLLIEGQKGISPDHQRLIFKAKQLDEDLYPEDDGYHENQGRTLAMYGVKDGSTIHIITRLSGS